MANPSSRQAVLDPYSSRYRWVMLALLWLLYACFGSIFRCLSPLITPILQDLNISYSQMGLILGSWQLTYMGSAGGLFFCISEIGGFLSPMVVGMLVDWAGDFLVGGYFIMVLGFAIFLLTFLNELPRSKLRGIGRISSCRT